VRALAEIESAVLALRRARDPAPQRARALLALAEETLEHWIRARGEIPTDDTREGFRLLALHRQGARDVPSFNACRETCREIAYHYNLVTSEAAAPQAQHHATLLAMVVMHLLLFVSGKLEQEKLGEFCCSARPLRGEAVR
jgi:hypothetical protein